MHTAALPKQLLEGLRLPQPHAPTRAPLHAAVAVQDALPLLWRGWLVVHAEVNGLPGVAPALLALAAQHHAAVTHPGRGQRAALCVLTQCWHWKLIKVCLEWGVGVGGEVGDGWVGRASVLAAGEAND